MRRLGHRVWPELRESLPKQFIPLIGDRSTFRSIVSLVGDRSIFNPPAVITNFDYRFRVAEQLKEIGAEATILFEPERRDSAAAVGAAAAWAATRAPGTVVAVLAADHVFKDGAKFARLCAQGRRRGRSRRNRHLRGDPRPSGDRLRLYPPRRAYRSRSAGCVASNASSRSRTRSGQKPSSAKAMCGTRAISSSAPT